MHLSNTSLNLVSFENLYLGLYELTVRKSWKWSHFCYIDVCIVNKPVSYVFLAFFSLNEITYDFFSLCRVNAFLSSVECQSSLIHFSWLNNSFLFHFKLTLFQDTHRNVSQIYIHKDTHTHTHTHTHVHIHTNKDSFEGICNRYQQSTRMKVHKKNLPCALRPWRGWQACCQCILCQTNRKRPTHAQSGTKPIDISRVSLFFYKAVLKLTNHIIRK
jgi:hypothetical protein